MPRRPKLFTAENPAGRPDDGHVRHGSSDADLDADDSTPQRPSKTQRKAASHALQSLGEALAALSDARLADVPLDEGLRDAVMEYRRTRSFEGKRRQMQYIGKLMRRIDVAPIEQAVTDAQLGRARDALGLHLAEQWRAEMVAQDEAVARWMARFPDTSEPALRKLVAQARADIAGAVGERNGRAYRELFQFIRQHPLHS